MNTYCQTVAVLQAHGCQHLAAACQHFGTSIGDPGAVVQVNRMQTLQPGRNRPQAIVCDVLHPFKVHFRQQWAARRQSLRRKKIGAGGADRVHDDDDDDDKGGSELRYVSVVKMNRKIRNAGFR